MSETPTPAKPGRGAWTRIGGLLPARPGDDSKSGYYRSPAAGERMVGWAGRQPDATYNEVVVTAGVVAIQRQLNEMHLSGPLLAEDGLFGPRCGDAVGEVQSRYQLTVDRVLGPKTMQKIAGPAIVAIAQAWVVPAWCLTGIVGVEAQWDPAAVGAQTPWDTGPAQINRQAHASVTVAQATDFEWSLTWTAQALLDNRQSLRKAAVRAGLDEWEVAVAAHNSPRAARRWAETGEPGEDPDPQEYAEKVRAAGEDARR